MGELVMVLELAKGLCSNRTDFNLHEKAQCSRQVVEYVYYGYGKDRGDRVSILKGLKKRLEERRGKRAE